MNSKLLIAIIVALLLISFSIGEEIYVSMVFDDLAERLQSVKDPSNLTVEEIEPLQSWWYNKHKTLEVILPHNNINEITFVFGELIGAIKTDDMPSAEAQYYRLISTTDAVSEMYIFRIGNIF